MDTAVLALCPGLGCFLLDQVSEVVHAVRVAVEIAHRRDAGFHRHPQHVRVADTLRHVDIPAVHVTLDEAGQERLAHTINHLSVTRCLRGPRTGRHRVDGSTDLVEDDGGVLMDLLTVKQLN